MRLSYISLLIVSLVLVTSCAAKKTAEAENNASANAMKEQMMKDGFKMGTIVASKAEGDCPYVIQVEGEEESYFLDPINLDEVYKKDGAKIWFTFAGLRMMNRCEKANPVNLIAVEKRSK